MSKSERDTRQLRRLETLIDVVYAITIWRLFMLLPRPEENLGWESVLQLLSENGMRLGVVLIGIIVVIVYWKQSNMLFKHLERTDNTHITYSILQIFALLLFLYAMGLSAGFEGDAGARLMESIMAMLLGGFSLLGWRHAINKGNLVSDDLSTNDKQTISSRILAEPMTAAITIPFALYTPWLWEVSWLFYPIFIFLLRRK